MNTTRFLLLPLTLVACVAVTPKAELAAEIDHIHPAPIVDEEIQDRRQREAIDTMIAGRYQLAHKMFSVLAQDGLPTELLPAAGRCALLAGQLDTAREWLEHYLGLAPRDQFARLDLARVLLFSGDPRECLRQCREFGPKAGRNISFVELRVVANMALGDPDGARRALRFAESQGLTPAELTSLHALIRSEEIKP